MQQCSTTATVVKCHQQKQQGEEHQQQFSEKFSSESLSIRAQRKIASKMSTKTTAKRLLTDGQARLLDCIYSILKQCYSKREAEKVVKNVIKIAVKLGLLNHNNQLSSSEIGQLSHCQSKMHSMALTVLSFAQVDHSYDVNYLMQAMADIFHSIQPIVAAHLSPKSTQRLLMVEQHLCTVNFIDALFSAKETKPNTTDSTKTIINELNALIDNGDI